MIETYNYRQMMSTAETIEELFSMSTNENRAFISTNLLSHIRDFVESVCAFLYEHDYKIKTCVERYERIKEGLRYVKKVEKYNFLSKFHNSLKYTVSHQTFRGEYAVRLTLNYIEGLIEIKKFLFDEFNVDIFTSIDKYPLNLDDSNEIYYDQITEILNEKYESKSFKGTNSYYVKKKKTLFYNKKIFYEVTLGPANDYATKANNFIIFTDINIFEQYAIRANIVERKIDLFGKVITINILTNYKVSIRPCELEKFGKIFGIRDKITRTIEYDNLMRYIQKTKDGINDILIYDENNYAVFLDELSKNAKTNTIQKIIESARSFVVTKKTGLNVILYLACIMNNVVLKSQVRREFSKHISNLYLAPGVGLFDELPYTTSLINHNPNIKDLLKCIDPNNHYFEFVKRAIDKNANENGLLYTKESEIEMGGNLDDCINLYNNAVSYYLGRKIGKFGNNVYSIENEKNTKFIIDKLLELSTRVSVKNYYNFAKGYLENNYLDIEQEKIENMKHMFDTGDVFLVYGGAGTGKSTLAGFELKMLGDVSKLCLANTHPALQNMVNKFKDNKIDYLTISKFIRGKKVKTKYDIVVIDECSNIKNSDIAKVLDKVDTKLFLLMGDPYQIEAVNFGNWFSLIEKIIPLERKCILTKTFRTKESLLLTLWDKVRTMHESLFAFLSAQQISHRFDESIFKKEYKDEIVLCLNYDGLYGVNNINKLLQLDNKNKEFKINNEIFKIGDPIIFTESEKFSDVIYNNLKGSIVDIIEEGEYVFFTLEIYRLLNELELKYSSVEFVENTDKNTTIIKMKISKYKEEDYDSDSKDMNHIPFQIAYATTVHKAQGLEYDSVKVVISNEVEERVSHNIFYTAVTRAKKMVKIYWSEEVEKDILQNFELKSIDRDIHILRSKFKYKLNAK